MIKLQVEKHEQMEKCRERAAQPCSILSYRLGGWSDQMFLTRGNGTPSLFLFAGNFWRGEGGGKLKLRGQI
jgi:hypothetical protein